MRRVIYSTDISDAHFCYSRLILFYARENISNVLYFHNKAPQPSYMQYNICLITFILELHRVSRLKCLIIVNDDSD